jgi:hypothetical protein
MATNGKPSDLSPKPWQEKVDPDFRLRFPRAGVEYVETLLDSSWPPEIFLTENEQTTDIVIRFPATSHKLPDATRNAYFTTDFTLAKAFDEVLRGFTDQDGERTTRSELARVAFSALRSTWIHVFETLYLHQFHPLTDERLQAAVSRLKDSSNKRKGRPKDSPSDRRNLDEKYQKMLAIAIFFHETSEKIVGEHAQGGATSVQAITNKIWGSTREELSHKFYGARAAQLIFSGAAFNDMVITRRGASLVKPSTWQPEELALTLLNLDEPKRYRMVNGKLTAVRSKKRAKS